MSDLSIYESDVLHNEVVATVEQVKGDLLDLIENLNYMKDEDVLEIIKKEFIKVIDNEIEIEKSRSDK